MAKSLMTEWYCRVSTKEDDNTPLLCPRCKSQFAPGPIFDHDPRTCHSCGTTLFEWFLAPAIYLIDIERAPEIVKALVDYSKPLGETDAFMQLSMLLEFLGVEEL